MWIRSRAGSAVPTSLHRLLDRRALHGRAEHLVGGDCVHHLLEGHRPFALLVFVLVSVVVARGSRLLRVGAYRALHAGGRVDAVTGQDVVDPRQGLGKAVVFTCIQLNVHELRMLRIFTRC